MSSNNSNIKMHAYTTYDYSLDANANTTFVQADPSNFPAVVQRLTGSSSSLLRPPSDVGVRRNAASFKLHERRQQQQEGQRGVMRKLDMIKLNNNSNNNYGPMNGAVRPKGGRNNDMVSPVSTLDGLGLGLGSPSPRSSCSSMSMMSEEEERAIICEKGFYLHPTREFHEPKLLQLFPLHSSRAFRD